MPQISKGERPLLGTRVSKVVTDAAHKRRADLGFKTMSDYLAYLIAADVHMPDQALKPVNITTSQELPIADVA
ncbi:hypothetical protein [Clavibacter michiganensis]|uniref:hypothetical protein n=1 Tax=Clavibacter michiganensis TaxID=28447 RepID=UPI00307A54F9